MKFVVLAFLSFFMSVNISSAEGLPANPWGNPQRIKNLQQETNNAAVQSMEQISNVLNDNENIEKLRKLVEANQTEPQERKFQNLVNQAEIMAALAKFNNNGSNEIKNNNLYKNISQEKDKFQMQNYERELQLLKRKYGDIKNRSLNMIDNSYHRTVSTIKKSTGVDVDRAVKDSINALK